MKSVVSAKYFSRADMLNKIELLALNTTKEITSISNSSLSLLISGKENCFLNESGVLQCGNKRTSKTLLNKRSKQVSNKYVKVWLVLNYVHMLISSDREVTLREAYYFLKTHFENQAEFTKRLIDIMGLFECKRECLGIVGSTSGAIGGLVQWIEPNQVCDCSNTSLGGKRIPGSVKHVTFRSLGARYIIVVEKDAIFNMLCEDKIWEKIPCILFTGCGYPSLSARQVLKKLEYDVSVPILGLFDYNPHGVKILFTYKFGSFGLGIETLHYTVDIHWLGVHYSDMVEQPSVPDHVWMEWSKSDLATHKANSSTFSAKLSATACAELAKMGEIRKKAEIEALEYRCPIQKLIIDKILYNKHIRLT